MHTGLKSVGLTIATFLSLHLLPLSVVAAQPSASTIVLAETPANKKLLETAKQHYRRAEFKQAIALYQQALTQAQQSGDRSNQIEALLQLGNIDFWISNIPQAEVKFQQALKLAREIKDPVCEGSALALLSVVYRNRQDYAKATNLLQESLAIAQQTKDKKLEARSRLVMGTVLYQQEQYSKALEALQQALKTAQTDNNQDEIAHIYDWMTITFIQLKELKQAETTAQQQQKLSQDISYRLAEYDGLHTIAVLKQEQKQTEAVLQARQQGLAIARASDNPWFQKNMLIEIGLIYVNQKQLSKGLEFYQKALTIAQTIDDAAVAEVQNRTGVGYYRAEQYPEALTAFQQALSTYQRTDRPAETIQVWLNIGDAYDQQQQYPQAIAVYQQARATARKLSDPDQELKAILAEGLGYVSQAQSLAQAGAYKQAIRAFELAIPVLKDAQTLASNLQQVERERLAIRHIEIAYRGKGFALSSQQQYPQAVVAFEQTLAFWQQHRDRLDPSTFLKEEQAILSTFAGAYANNGQYAQAVTTYEAALKVAEQRNEVKNQDQLLGLIAANYNRLGDHRRALEISQQQLTLARAKLKQDPKAELAALLRVGQTFGNLGKTDAELEHYQQALTIARSLKQQNDEAALLNNIGGAYQRQGEYFKALEPLQQVLTIRQRAIQRLQAGEAQSVEQLCSANTASLKTEGRRICLERFHMAVTSTLNNLAKAYHGLGRYTEARQTYEQALEIALKYKEPDRQTTVLNNIGTVYLSIGNYPRALEYFQKSLKIAIATGARPQQTSTLNNIGNVYITQGQSAKALDYFQQSLALAKVMQAADLEATALLNIGYVYSDRAEYNRALEFYQQALAISRSQNLSSITVLNNIASVYSSQGNYSQAVEQYQQTLELARKTGDRPMEVTLLRNIGGMFHNQANYARALESYQQAQKLSQAMGSRSSELSDLLVQGNFHRDLGQYPQALALYQQALALSRALGERDSEIVATGNIGAVYRRQAQYPQAIEWYQQALSLLQKMGNIAGENTILVRLAQTYEKQGKLAEAEALLQQALAFNRQTGARPNEAITLSILGRVYAAQGKVNGAQEAFQQALVIAPSVRDRTTEAEILADLGKLLQAQPELAIFFYKQSVKLTEDIRTGIRTLPKDQQQSYTETVADTYRQLADLLLKRDRVLEAQQVLDLLKLQELDGYLRNVRGSGQNLYELPPEQAILKKYNALNQSTIVLGQELNSLQEIARSGKALTPVQEQRKEQLRQLQEALKQQFIDFAKDKDVTDLLKQLTLAEPNVTIPLEDLAGFSKKLAKLNAVMVYPLVLEKRLELIITTPNAQPLRRTVNVTRQELNQTIQEFRAALQDPTRDARPTAQKLYTWLIKPLEADLQAAKPKTIIYAPDGPLRYIPLAALYDGQKWLVQRYAINNITSKSVDDLTTKPEGKLRVLAGAFGTTDQQVRFAGQTVPFRGLAFTVKEVKALAQRLPGTVELLGQAFTPTATTRQMNEYTIVHLATHASLVPEAGNSFIVFGNGTTTSLIDIEAWTLDAVDLIVLSACETGLGGKFGKNGEEVLGLGYQFTKKDKAKAAIASLWSVNDGGTQVLMDAFYANLQAGKTKAEALSQAQVTLITGKAEASGSDRAATLVTRWQGQLPSKVINQLNHPYYWAPFILIGNGL